MRKLLAWFKEYSINTVNHLITVCIPKQGACLLSLCLLLPLATNKTSTSIYQHLTKFLFINKTWITRLYSLTKHCYMKRHTQLKVQCNYITFLCICCSDTKLFLMGHPKFLWKNLRLMKLALFLPSDFLKALSDIVSSRQTSEN